MSVPASLLVIEKATALTTLILQLMQTQSAVMAYLSKLQAEGRDPTPEEMTQIHSDLDAAAALARSHLTPPVSGS